MRSDPVPPGSLAIGAKVDIGKSRIEGDGLVRIEGKRPGACLKLHGIERAGSLQRRHAGLGIEGEWKTRDSAEGLKAGEERLGRFVKGSGRLLSPNTFQTIAHQPPGRSSSATLTKAMSSFSQ